MSLVSEPSSLPEEVLEKLLRSLRDDLLETLEMVRRQRGKIVDPASLLTAQELLEATLALLDQPDARDPRRGVGEANLAYASMLAAIDLVKSHTDVPRVPVAKGKAGPAP